MQKLYATHRIFTVLVFALTGLAGGVMAQNYVNNCPNLDLSMGNFTNWVGFTGTPPNGGCCPINTPTIGIVANRHVVTTAPGTDQTQGGPIAALTNTPPGYPRAARLGNQLTGRQAEALRYTYTPNMNTALFEYNYAVVLQDPGHSAAQQPRFELQVMNANNQAIPCTFYQVAASGGIPGFQSQGNVRWKNWTKVGVDLSGQVGNPVTIEARTGDCSLSGHYGYGYVVGSCRPLIIITAYCVGDSVATLIAPDGFSTYRWFIQGQPQVLSTQQSYVINNPTNGIVYEVEITSVTGCVATLSTVVNPVIVYPGFTYTTGCNNLVNFTDTTFVLNGIAGDWTWDFGDGNTSTQQNPSHNYAQPGTYQVTLNVASTVGCDSAITLPVVVDSDPVADFTLPTNCGITNTFTDLSFVPNGLGNLTGWSWNFGDGNTSNSQNPTHTFAAPGTYDITLTVTSSNSCTHTLTQSYTHNPFPTADFTATTECNLDATIFTDNSSVLLNNTVTQWNWFFGDGNTSNSQNPQHTFANPGTYNVMLVATTDGNCADTLVVPVTVHPNPQPNFQFTEICNGLSTTFTNTSNILTGNIVAYDWDFGDAAVGVSQLENPVVFYPNSGSFPVTLTATSEFGCTASVTQNINVWPKPQINFSANVTSGCFPVTPTFNNLTTIASGSVVSWAWTFGDGRNSNQQSPTNPYPNAAGDYTVTLTAISDRGCDTTLTFIDYITVYPQPIAEFGYTPPFPTIIESTVQFINQSFLGESFFWDLGDGTTSQAFAPNHTYAQDTATYDVTLVTTNQFGCIDSITHPVRINPTYTIYIPNAFSPNADGVNDHFRVRGLGIVELNMQIFDRWGDPVSTFENLDPMNKGWDGTKDGTDMKQDVYVYRIQARDIFGEWHEYFGQINLIR